MTGTEPEAATRAPAGHVLCIEDDPVSMALVEALLAAFESVILSKAFTGRHGIEMALTLAPDLVLLDMHLPDLAGLEVVRALNEKVSEGYFRLVLLTADPFSVEIAKAMSLGARDHWQKPLTLELLQGSLPRELQGARADRIRHGLR